jgi:hypothetical protein
MRSQQYLLIIIVDNSDRISMAVHKQTVAMAKPRANVTIAFRIVGHMVASLLLINAMNINLEAARSERSAVIKRRRSHVEEFEHQLGRYFQRAYRMPNEKFWKLVQLITSLITVGLRKKGPNGYITPALRVSAALRYLAGGSAYDIMLSHGLSHSSFFVSVWATVEAINKHPRLAIKFPTDHAKQRIIAMGFKAKSRAGFDCCVGAIDGMLVWTEKPSEWNLAFMSLPSIILGQANL